MTYKHHVLIKTNEGYKCVRCGRYYKDKNEPGPCKPTSF